MGNLVKNLFSQEDLKAIASAIGEAEQTTSGEIRVSIRQKRKWTERSVSLDALTKKEFQHLGMTRTSQRTGVLIFLLLSDKQFHIFADEGIHSKVEDGTWENIAQQMSKHFSQKNYRQGIIHGVKEVGAVLSQFFPNTGTTKNELSNEVNID